MREFRRWLGTLWWVMTTRNERINVRRTVQENLPHATNKTIYDATKRGKDRLKKWAEQFDPYWEDFTTQRTFTALEIRIAFFTERKAAYWWWVFTHPEWINSVKRKLL